jgi:hypothetical protein
MTKINELLPLHNVQYEKNTASGCTIQKNNVRYVFQGLYKFKCTIFELFSFAYYVVIKTEWEIPF